MTTVAITAFYASLASLGFLFVLKLMELSRGAVFFPPVRAWADDQARALKRKIIALSEAIENLPSRTVLVGRVLLHASAVGVAKLARSAERQAHKIADLASYKHRFERKETQSDFLKQVSEHKNGLNGDGNGGH